MWDWFFFASSLGLTVLLGVALGNVVRGVSLDQAGNINVSLLDLLNPFSVFLGITAAAMLCLHGAIFLTQKVEAELRDRVTALIPKLLLTFVILMTTLIIWTLKLDRAIARNYRDRPWIAIFPALGLLTVFAAWRFVRKPYYLSAFISSAAMIAALMAAIAAGLYPVMVSSTLDSSFDLTVNNAASAPETLTVMLVIAIIGMPFVLLYTVGVYYFFRGKVQLDDESY